MYTIYLTVCLMSSLFSQIQALTYTLDKSYSGSTFFQGFDFFTGSDPTHGFVSYVSASQASSGGFAGIARNGAAYLGVDYKTQLTPSDPGRKSVRISSKKSWTHGLFIADIAHMPGGICGTWPAFWTLGPNWPQTGEIDIIEGVNSQRTNIMSLHTSANCVLSPSPQLGTVQSSNCDGSTNQNAGCGITATSPSTYGKGFNAGGGGVYAMEWTSSAIKIWSFPPSSVPANIKSGKPVTSTWGTPLANYQGCNIDAHFKDHKIIFDTTFCGDWGGSVWQNDATCKGLAATCNDFVAANPSAFRDAYWSINSVKVYTSAPSVNTKSVNVGDTSQDHLSSKEAAVVTNVTTPVKQAPSDQQVPMDDSSSGRDRPAGNPLENTSAQHNPSHKDLPLEDPSVVDHSRNKSSTGTTSYIAPPYETPYHALHSPELEPASCDAQSKLASAGVLHSGDSPSTTDSHAPIFSPSIGTGDQNEALVPFSAAAFINVQKRDTTPVRDLGAVAQVFSPSPGAAAGDCDGSSGGTELEKRVVVDDRRHFPKIYGVGNNSHKLTHESSSSSTSVYIHHSSTLLDSSSHSDVSWDDHTIYNEHGSQSSDDPTILRRQAVPSLHTPSTSDSSNTGVNTPFHYEGCYGLYTITGFVVSLSEYDITQPRCVDTCNDKGSIFAGVHGQDCYCGSDLASSPSQDQDCNFPCAADPATYCGGFSPPSITVLQIEHNSGSQTLQPPKDATSDQKPAVIQGDSKKPPITIDVGGTYNIFLTHNRKGADDSNDAHNNGGTHDTEILYTTITSCPCTETQSSLATATLPSNPIAAQVSNSPSNADSDNANARQKLDDTSLAVDSVLSPQNTSSPAHSQPQNKTSPQTSTSNPLDPAPLAPSSPTTLPLPPARSNAGDSGKPVTGSGNRLRFRGIDMGVWGVVLAWMAFWGFVGMVIGDWVFIGSIAEEVIAVGGDVRV